MLFVKELTSSELLGEHEIAKTLDNTDWLNVEDEIPHLSLSEKMGFTIASYLVDWL